MILALVAGLIGFWLGLFAACLFSAAELDALHRRNAELYALCEQACAALQEPDPLESYGVPRFRSIEQIAVDRLIEDTRGSA